MKKIIIFTICLSSIFLNQTNGQNWGHQYFDGNDSPCNPNTYNPNVCLTIENDSTNIWQIGVPQKIIFNMAASTPNALITDTVNPYPVNNISIFKLEVNNFASYAGLNGITAIRWLQKLDMDYGLDGGKIEFSVDSGSTWENAFNNPNVYNFYGYQSSNVDTLPNGDWVFTGTDSIWRDIWLCFDNSFLAINQDKIILRYAFISDSIDNNKEGWMIDNMFIHLTIFHSVNEIKPDKYLKVFPNPSSEIIYIETEKIKDFHIIEKMELVNPLGQVMNVWKNIPTKYFISVNEYKNGLYYLKVKTNINNEVIPIIINHN